MGKERKFLFLCAQIVLQKKPLLWVIRLLFGFVITAVVREVKNDVSL